MSHHSVIGLPVVHGNSRAMELSFRTPWWPYGTRLALPWNRDGSP